MEEWISKNNFEVVIEKSVTFDVHSFPSVTDLDNKIKAKYKIVLQEPIPQNIYHSNYNDDGVSYINNEEDKLEICIETTGEPMADHQSS